MARLKPRPFKAGLRVGGKNALGSGDPEAARPDVFTVQTGREYLQCPGHSCEAVFPSGKGVAQDVRMKLLHAAARPHDLERRVEGEKRLEHVLLAPEAQVGHDELLGVIQGCKDVVEMDHDARRELGQKAQALKDHVAID